MLLLTILILCSCLDISKGKEVYVNTSRGQVIGFHVDNGDDRTKLFYGQADVFLGIPFVIPPVGEMRFKVRCSIIAGKRAGDKFKK